MCYDMSYFSSIKLIADFLNLPQTPSIDFTATYHQVAQSYCIWPVALHEDGEIKIKLFEWALIAPYMNTDEKIKQYRSSMANARSEKILEDKKSVWHRLRHQRCLVFTTGFFEHRDIGLKKKLPYFIKIKNVEIFCFAGLYNYSPVPDKDTGEQKGSFTIITRTGNSLMKKIHNDGANAGRMPLVLNASLSHQWLSPNLTDAEMKQILNYEFPETEMEAWPVNTIRTRKPDDEKIIEKIHMNGISL